MSPALSCVDVVMEKTLNITFTINILKAKNRYCAHFCILFLLKYYKLDTNNTFHDLVHYNRYTKTWFMLPWQLSSILHNKSINCTIYKYNKEEIQKSLQSNKPVVQFIAHWYNHCYNINSAIWWNIFKWLVRQHYIVIVWFDTYGWICYDPAFDSTWNNYLYVSYTLMDKAVRRSGLGIFYNKISFYLK